MQFSGVEQDSSQPAFLAISDNDLPPSKTEEDRGTISKGVTFSPKDVVVELKSLQCSDATVTKAKGRDGYNRRASFRRDPARKLQRLASSMPGDTELQDYMDGLAKEPEKLTTPHNADTGETIIHLLAKEGKVEILRNLLADARVERNVLTALLKQDKLGWNPIMTAIRADTGGDEMVEMFLMFLENRLGQSDLGTLLTSKNISGDTVFTLLMRSTTCMDSPLCTTDDDSNSNSRRLLFNMIAKRSGSVNDAEALHRWMLVLVQQLLTPNSCDLTARSMRDIINLLSATAAELSSVLRISTVGEDSVDLYDFEALFSIKDEDGNNLLMELAKNMKDDALRELLTSPATSNHVTHSVLLSTNKLGQTLLTLIEVNRESLSESLPLVLKREYGCHRRDMIRTELCLSDQLETSASASEIIQELHQLEPKSCWQIFLIWATLFLSSLTPNIGLAMSDIFSDAYLTLEYRSHMLNSTFVEMHVRECTRLKNMSPIPLQAYAACLDSNSQFYYTVTFLLVPLLFYLTEFLTLTSDYEPTGLRTRMKKAWKNLRDPSRTWMEFLLLSWNLVALLTLTFFALILWQPVTAICKFYRDARYEACEGTTKVIRRKEKRYVDLAASRGELIEVSIEAAFEPMVQGYIIFPSIISIIQRLANSVTVSDDGTIQIDFKLKGIETAQIFSICISLVSLAWCFSEYNSVRKNMLLDITVSPCSRVVMCLFMLIQVVARLLAFMLFTLFWGPGNFYPLMVFVAIHMLIAAAIHIVFSEDIAFWKKGQYLKFFHNVMMNAFATIYFHNYLRFDEMPTSATSSSKLIVNASFNISNDEFKERQTVPNLDSAETKTTKDPGEFQFIDAQRPGLHISTFLRQLTFDILYTVEYGILLSFGFSSDVKDLIDQKRRPILVSVIIVFSALALSLRLFYYNVMHVWRNVIVTGKKPIRQEIRNLADMKNDRENAYANVADSTSNIQSRFFKYVFISRNTWILGRLKHIETTIIVLPKKIIEAIKGRGQDLEYNFTDVGRQVDRSWISSAKCSSPQHFFQSLKLNNLILSLLFFPLVILVIVINVAIIVLLIMGLVMTIPVAIVVFLYNLKSGFRAVELADEEEGQNTLELPPVDNGGIGSLGSKEKGLFNCDPSRTLSAVQKDLEDRGVLDLSRNPDITADEFEIFVMLLLSLNRKKYPLKRLHLDNCDITDEKLAKLAPLIVKFEKVTLNGSQKMTTAGWEVLRSTVFKTSLHVSSMKLRKLELKITKNEEDVIRFRREILLEELKRSSMTGEALTKIGQFIPRLEKVYLDDIFSDSGNILDLIKQTSRSSDELVEAWKSLGRSVMSCRVTSRKLRFLSLPGCAINDEILGILAPSLVTIKVVHLGRNPITSQGWESFKNVYLDEDAAVARGLGGAALTHLSLNALTESSCNAGTKLLLTSAGMAHLASLLPLLEEADFSGQCEVGLDGWANLASSLQNAKEKGTNINLRKLVLNGCNFRPETRDMLEEAVAVYHPSLKIDFGLDKQFQKRQRRLKSCW